MTPVRQHAVLRRVKDITLSTTLSLALLGGVPLLQSCGNNQSEREQTETTVQQGVRTYITETSPGSFKITDEVETTSGKADAIVNYIDGHRDTLSVEAARRLVENDPSTNTYLHNPGAYHSYHRNGLANALLWGSLGYMLGRSTAPQYRDDERRYASGIYANPATYQRASRVSETVRSSRVARSSRPSGGRSGFFSRMSRSFSG